MQVAVVRFGCVEVDMDFERARMLAGEGDTDAILEYYRLARRRGDEEAMIDAIDLMLDVPFSRELWEIHSRGLIGAIERRETGTLNSIRQTLARALHLGFNEAWLSTNHFLADPGTGFFIGINELRLRIQDRLGWTFFEVRAESRYFSGGGAWWCVIRYLDPVDYSDMTSLIGDFHELGCSVNGPRVGGGQLDPPDGDTPYVIDITAPSLATTIGGHSDNSINMWLTLQKHIEEFVDADFAIITGGVRI